MALRKELFWVLALKCLLLFFLWCLFFSHPLQDHLNSQKLAQHFVPIKGDSHGHLK